MKNKIIVENPENGTLAFYYLWDSRRFYLFTQDFTIGVYRFFKHGVTERELYDYHGWGRNPRLDKTIEKTPVYIRYIKKYKEGIAC